MTDSTYIAEVFEPKHIRAEIRESLDHELVSNTYIMGYYLYIYEGNNERCTWDYHYETLEGAMRHVRDFNIPLSAWKKVK